MDSIVIFIFELVVLIFSVMIHEISHGFVAERLGDPTARMAGRLTLNPLKHIDPFGSIILPLLLAIPALFGQSPILFGWAKPVPYNPLNLKDPKKGAGFIAAAGPISNLSLALAFGIVIRAFAASGAPMDSPLILLFSLIAYINITLAIFNLVPLPPLDGSKVLFSFLPHKNWAYSLADTLERNGMILVILFIFFGFSLISPLIRIVFTLFTGQAF